MGEGIAGNESWLGEILSIAREFRLAGLSPEFSAHGRNLTFTGPCTAGIHQWSNKLNSHR
jgi:hypothetical protein